MKRKYIIALIVIILLALIVFRLASNKRTLDKKKEPAKDTLVRIPVKVAAVKAERRELSMLKTGTLAPFKEAKVLATTGGTIRQLRFNLGDHVSEGQVLAVIDTRSAQLDLQKAESDAAKLRRDLDTYTELLTGQAATQEKVNEIRQNYLDAVNQVNQVKKQLSDASIKAPTSGIISEKPVEQGVFANAGTQIATIVNLSQAKVQLNLTENEVYQVRQGQPVKITTDVYPGQVFNGRISFISPQADETHNYRVEVMAANKDSSPLRSGTFVYADFSRQTTQDVLLIPRDALTQSVKDASVYVVENNVVHQKPVKAGIEMNGLIQVVSGLKAGEIVVTSGQINLKDGTQVIISK
ncbi:efflux RND transporter periplasmic adaptor subunit [Mucilaginibacter sp. SMC90]|uniref:efflux RND transporter periplasmic adaptor subunit n=1 Tax=Mucilaginibacter sp. SMC90 TaxID=2929803 RepID=UPI001FB424F7|nr:efflux RND transporter periplasmic adaptor subunit [Mucilaginibacter sp. SMC90]UOE49812.1 efflux RND transporter periplasmic adaptor subunit [Mucilaginibacter sp. SMC90]